MNISLKKKKSANQNYKTHKKNNKKKKHQQFGSDFISGDIKKLEWFGQNTSNILES